MTKSTKKIVAFTSAIMIAASMSVVSMAADYAVNPSFNGDGGASSASAATIAEAVDEAADSKVETSVNNTIEEAVAAPEGSEAPVAEVAVTSTAKLTISAETIAKLADVEDAQLVIKSPKMTLTIDANSIKSAKKVNLSSTVKSSTKQSVLTFASKKDFGCKVKVKITSCRLSKAKLMKAHVYCDGEDLGPVKLEAGKPVFTVSKGGKYVIK